MSFLDEIRSKRSQLKATDTVITCADGKKYKESGETITELKEFSCGFVVDTKPDKIPAVILDEGLLLGSQDSVDIVNIQQYRITHILSVGINCPPIDDASLITFKYLPCLDLPESDLKSLIQSSNAFILDALSCGGKVLVHCNAGVSRSAALVIGFLITEKQFKFDDAYQLVKSKRSCIQPNAGFLLQLKRL